MNADTVALIAVLGSFATTAGTVIGTILINRAQARKTIAEAKALELDTEKQKEKDAEDEAEKQLAFLKRVGEMYDTAIARNQIEIKSLRSDVDTLSIAKEELKQANEKLRLAIIKFVHAFEIYICNVRPSPKVNEIKLQLEELKALIA